MKGRPKHSVRSSRPLWPLTATSLVLAAVVAAMLSALLGAVARPG